MALGAKGAGVVAMVIGSGARLVVFGTAIGVPAAWFTSRGVESMLVGLTPADPAALRRRGGAAGACCPAVPPPFPRDGPPGSIRWRRCGTNERQARYDRQGGSRGREK